MQIKVDDAEAVRESAVTHTIGIEVGELPRSLRIVRRDGDALSVLDTVQDSDEHFTHVFDNLASALIMLLQYASDADEPEPTILPLSGAVLAALGQPLYTAPVGLYADLVEAPAGGPYWQVRNARTEEGWHDVTAVAECEQAGCEVRRHNGGCTVLVSDAYADGLAHWSPNVTLPVRIPAGDA